MTDIAGIKKPFYRIFRPGKCDFAYVEDARYANNRLQLSRAYLSIEKELRNIFDYIEPDDRNKKVFSLKLYTLLLRACTEVELNCKQILDANGARPIKHNQFTMEDYVKLQKSSKLSFYSLTFKNWRKRDNSSQNIEFINKIYHPFKSFSGKNPKAPNWYNNYNSVKHDREGNIENANLDNCMNAVAGILVLLFSQFGPSCIDTYGTTGNGGHVGQEYYEHIDADIIFELTSPSECHWPKNEQYNFSWVDLKETEDPFDKFDFNSIK